MQVEHTELPGVLLITPKRFGDHRGYLSETYSRRAYAKIGLELEFVQDNQSMSAQIGTLRGLHFQSPPHAQAKLVRCAAGALFDVAVDIRRGSPTFGKWVGYELSAENGVQMFIPAGFAHGFATRAPNTEIAYKCSAYYAPRSEGALAWDDPDVGIAWPLENPPVLSEKDAAAPNLAALDSPFTWEGGR